MPQSVTPPQHSFSSQHGKLWRCKHMHDCIVGHEGPAGNVRAWLQHTDGEAEATTLCDIQLASCRSHYFQLASCMYKIQASTVNRESDYKAQAAVVRLGTAGSAVANWVTAGP
jgi:hypothetical protein